MHTRNIFFTEFGADGANIFLQKSMKTCSLKIAPLFVTSTYNLLFRYICKEGNIIFCNHINF